MGKENINKALSKSPMNKNNLNIETENLEETTYQRPPAKDIKKVKSLMKKAQNLDIQTTNTSDIDYFLARDTP